jgi:hypothetical protein
MTTTTNSATAARLLHNKFLMCGEILPAADIAHFLADMEADNGFTLSTEEIHRAVWEASDCFVDSMQENASSHLAGEELEEEIARLENMRPAARRRAQITAILTLEA